MNKKLIIGGAVFASASACGLSLLYRHAFARQEPFIIHQFHHRAGTHDTDYYEERDSEEQAARTAPHTELHTVSSRKKRLAGYLWQAGDVKSNTVAFLIHGFRSNAFQAAGPYLSYYKSRGVDVFACDHAAAGASQGRFYSYDYYEAKDCLLWVKALTSLYGKNVRIILHGFSMGAATVLQMSDCCPAQVRFLVSDCGYTSAREILTYQTRGSRLTYPLLRAVNRLVSHFDLDKTDVRPHVERTSLPILFVHGTADPTVPYAMAEDLYRRCGSSRKELLSVPDGLHVESYRRDRAGYERKLDAYLNRCCPR